MDMCHGSLFSQIFRFSIPLLLTNIMVMLFHAADLIVLGQFAPDNVKTAATAAVGATFALHILLTVFFSGFSAGVNAVTARYIGAKDNKKVSETVHTSITLGIYASFVIMIFGLFLSRPALEMISTPADVIDKAVIYLQIYCIGLPFSSLYFIGAAILRAIGDTRRPLLFIMIAGAVNVLLNLFLSLFSGWIPPVWRPPPNFPMPFQHCLFCEHCISQEELSGCISTSSASIGRLSKRSYGSVYRPGYRECFSVFQMFSSNLR